MPATVTEEKIHEIADKWHHREGFLIEMIQDIQKEYHYVPQEAMQALAREVGIAVGRVYHLATFFKGFSLRPRGEYVISVCMGTACHIKGAPRLVGACARELGIKEGQTTADGKFTLETVRCLGCCGLAAVMTVNENLHGHVVAAKIPPMLKRYRERGPQDHGEDDDE